MAQAALVTPALPPDRVFPPQRAHLRNPVLLRNHVSPANPALQQWNPVFLQNRAAPPV
jgi:hypothetical protein